MGRVGSGRLRRGCRVDISCGRVAVASKRRRGFGPQATAAPELLPDMPTETRGAARVALRALGVEMLFETRCDRVAPAADPAGGAFELKSAGGVESRTFDACVRCFGARPQTAWLDGFCARDARGFVVVGDPSGPGYAPAFATPGYAPAFATTSLGTAAAASWIFCGDESRRRERCKSHRMRASSHRVGLHSAGRRPRPLRRRRRRKRLGRRRLRGQARRAAFGIVPATGV